MNRILHAVLAGMVAAGPAQAQLCQPELVRSIGGPTYDVRVVGTLAFAATASGVVIVDIAGQDTQTVVGWQDTPAAAVGIAVEGATA